MAGSLGNYLDGIFSRQIGSVRVRHCAMIADVFRRRGREASIDFAPDDQVPAHFTDTRDYTAHFPCSTGIAIHTRPHGGAARATTNSNYQPERLRLSRTSQRPNWPATAGLATGAGSGGVREHRIQEIGRAHV